MTVEKTTPEPRCTWCDMQKNVTQHAPGHDREPESGGRHRFRAPINPAREGMEERRSRTSPRNRTEPREAGNEGYSRSSEHAWPPVSMHEQHRRVWAAIADHFDDAWDDSVKAESDGRAMDLPDAAAFIAEYLTPRILAALGSVEQAASPEQAAADAALVEALHPGDISHEP